MQLLLGFILLSIYGKHAAGDSSEAQVCDMSLAGGNGSGYNIVAGHNTCDNNCGDGTNDGTVCDNNVAQGPL